MRFQRTGKGQAKLFARVDHARLLAGLLGYANRATKAATRPLIPYYYEVADAAKYPSSQIPYESDWIGKVLDHSVAL